MATQPQPPAKPPGSGPGGQPAPTPPAQQPANPAAKATGDEPVRTVADEQRERSEAMQAEGVEAFKARLDERDPDERPRSVPGAGFRVAATEGAERSTPEARAAQNKASP